MTIRKKLIEVALPLEAINQASGREKSVRNGHPSTLHIWWARRPLAACRAVLFASIVDDPSSHPEKFPTEEAQETERQRLFRIIEDLVKWENSTNEQVLMAARAEIMKATNNRPPPVLDPFCGGGSIPLEAQRLGLEAHASDLNPVAVLITKAMVEIPPLFVERPPVNPEARNKFDHSGAWRGAQGLAEDVRYYGKWMRDEAEKRIGHLYPKARMPDGKEGTVLAWLWARTVKCPNPACGAMMPLIRSFALSTRKGKEARVEPVVNAQTRTVTFEVKTGKGTLSESPKVGRGANFRCLVCKQIANEQNIRTEFQAKLNGDQLLAIVAEGERGRVYLTPSQEHERTGRTNLEPQTFPDADMVVNSRYMTPTMYGMTKHRDLFTPRQLVALTTFSDLVREAREKVLADAREAGIEDDEVMLDKGGKGATAYADAVAIFLGITSSKAARFNITLSFWRADEGKLSRAFGRQALAMTWDYAEANPFASAGGDFKDLVNGTVAVLENGPVATAGKVHQLDASSAVLSTMPVLLSTDPPYYDNVPYADLSDVFYVWLRRSLNRIYPSLFSTLLVPKNQELVADPQRQGGRENARHFFEHGLAKAFDRMFAVQTPEYPMTVYYGFKQSETIGDEERSEAIASTGWETMLEGLLATGFQITGTWPVRTEGPTRMRGLGSNALASSIILVCRPRPQSASLATRREFLNALKRELPPSLKNLQRGNIAPVDLAQAAIGPGMAVFSQYSKVIESDGSPMRVRTALQLINQALDEVLAEQESEYDAETRWAVAWFEQFGISAGAYGTAETLSKAKNTSVAGMDEAGVTTSRAGKVRLVRRDELPDEWDPTKDKRLTVWEVAQHMIRALETGGESSAASLFKKVGGLAEIARDLAYRLYTISERKGWSQEALAYNSLVVAWPEIKRLAGLSEARTTDTLFETAP